MSENKKPVLWASKKEGTKREPIMALWREEAGPDSKNPGMVYFSGYANVEGEKIRFTAFPAEHNGKGYLRLVDKENNLIGTGNPVNSRSDGKAVYYDTYIFNFKLGNDPVPKIVSAYVSPACDADTHKILGFTSPQIPRPQRGASSKKETQVAPDVSNIAGAPEAPESEPEPNEPSVGGGMKP